MMEQPVFVVTGAGSGLGLETSRALAGMGHRVLMVTRTIEKGEIAREDIFQTVPTAELEVYAGDMGLMREVRRVGEEILDRHERIDGLVNNVGTWLSKYTLTDEGLEVMFATNHLSYFLMTHVLYPALRRADEPRVVNVSSNSHAFGRINLADPGLRRHYHGLRAYAQAKLANIYFTLELDRLKPDAHLRTYSVSPGLVKTDIGLKHTNRLHGFAWRVRRWLGQTPAQGAGTIVYCATDPSAAMRSGYYWEGCTIKEIFKSARDPGLGQQLWAMSQAMCGVSDYFHVEVESGHALSG